MSSFRLPRLDVAASPAEWEERYRPAVEYLMGLGSLITLRVRGGCWSAGILTDDRRLAEWIGRRWPAEEQDSPAVFTAIVLTGPVAANVLLQIKAGPGDGDGLAVAESALPAILTRAEGARFAALAPDERERLVLASPITLAVPAERLLVLLHPDGAGGADPAAVLAPLAAFLPVAGGHVPLLALTRGGRVESVQAGSIAVTDARGSRIAFAGDPGAPVFLRSAAKPFQAVPLVERGALTAFGWGDRELALACASHGGSAAHLAVVAGMLRSLGLSESDLACAPHPPLDAPSAAALLAGGVSPGRLHSNCSGKHAGFLAAARQAGEPLAGYCHPEHPVQRRVRAVLASATGVESGSLHAAVDGCGAPTFALPLAGLATAFARLADPAAAPPDLGPALARIAAAMAAAPDMVGGEGRFETELTRATGGRLLAKPGAEGVLGLATRGEGLGIAIKLEAGAGGAPLAAIAVEALEQFGLLGAGEIAALARWRRPPVTGHGGAPVGTAEPLFALR